MTDRDRHIEEAIDRVVREMIAVDPPPRLRHRVLERLEDTAPAWFTVPRLVATGGLLAAVVLLALLVQPTSDPVPQHVVASAPPARTSAPAVPPGVAVPDLRSESPLLATPPRARNVGPPVEVAEPVVTAAATSPVGGVEIDPLPLIDPITIAAVGPTEMTFAPPEIVIPPIELEPLEIGPLTLPR